MGGAEREKGIKTRSFLGTGPGHPQISALHFTKDRRERYTNTDYTNAHI